MKMKKQMLYAQTSQQQHFTLGVPNPVSCLERLPISLKTTQASRKKEDFSILLWTLQETLIHQNLKEVLILDEILKTISAPQTLEYHNGTILYKCVDQIMQSLTS